MRFPLLCLGIEPVAAPLNARGLDMDARLSVDRASTSVETPVAQIALG
jgi:hypothetical protein